MATAESTATNDVLQASEHSKLSAEEIAKAIAHHNRHHHDGQPASAAPQQGTGKKKK